METSWRRIALKLSTRSWLGGTGIVIFSHQRQSADGNDAGTLLQSGRALSFRAAVEATGGITGMSDGITCRIGRIFYRAALYARSSVHGPID